MCRRHLPIVGLLGALPNIGFYLNRSISVKNGALPSLKFLSIIVLWPARGMSQKEFFPPAWRFEVFPSGPGFMIDTGGKNWIKKN